MLIFDLDFFQKVWKSLKLLEVCFIASVQYLDFKTGAIQTSWKKRPQDHLWLSQSNLPLLSSVPTLPEDSVGEADAIMGIFGRWSSIIIKSKSRKKYCWVKKRNLWRTFEGVGGTGGILLHSLWSAGASDTFGWYHQLQLPLVAPVARPARVRHCLRVLLNDSSSKGSPGETGAGGED